MPTVADLMTRVLVTVTESQTLAEADAAMTRGGVRHLTVVDGERLVGVLSRTDVTHGSPDQRVATAVVRKVVTVRPETFLSEAVVAMLEHSIHCLPVLDAAGKLAGIITSTDLLVEAYEALRQVEVAATVAARRVDVDNTVLGAKLERVRRAHHADTRSIAFAELQRFLKRHFDRKGVEMTAAAVERPELGIDVAELRETQAKILADIAEQEADNRARAKSGESQPSPGTEALIHSIEEHSKVAAALLA